MHPRLHREIDVKGYRVQAELQVVTHHAPAAESLNPAFDGNLVNAAYASPMDDLLRDSNVDLWICWNEEVRDRIRVTGLASELARCPTYWALSCAAPR